MVGESKPPMAARAMVYRTDNTGRNLRAETSPESVLPLAIARKLRQFANRELGIASDKLRVTAIKPRTFDGCLGIFKPNQACTKIAIPGWQAVLTDGQRSWGVSSRSQCQPHHSKSSRE